MSSSGPDRKSASPSLSSQALAPPKDPRLAICAQLALGGLPQVHQLIVEATHKAPDTLLRRGLNAKTLIKLGYDKINMQRLGFGDATLAALGFGGPAAAPVLRKSSLPAAADPHDDPAPRRRAPATLPGTSPEVPLRPLPADDPVLRDQGVTPELRALLAQGYRAGDLRAAHWPVNDCKRAGLRVADLIRFGFMLSELAGACTPAELRREGFNVREMKKYFAAQELKDAGYSATDMRLGGFNIRELLSMGYNENHIRGAGFSNAELMREGISRVTREI